MSVTIRRIELYGKTFTANRFCLFTALSDCVDDVPLDVIVGIANCLREIVHGCFKPCTSVAPGLEPKAAPVVPQVLSNFVTRHLQIATNVAGAWNPGEFPHEWS